MKIAKFDKISLVSYPGRSACTIYVRGCNFKCPVCNRSDMIDLDGSCIDENEVLEYLDSKKNMIEGVCITGGEPLIQDDIVPFICKIKEFGYKIKLETNGSFPKKLKELIDNRYVDFVTMDIKNIYTKYDMASGIKTNIDAIKDSVNILESSRIDHEFRTTIAKELHNINDVRRMRAYLGRRANYYVHNFVNGDNVLNKRLHSFSNEELKDMKLNCSNDDIYFVGL